MRLIVPRSGASGSAFPSGAWERGDPLPDSRIQYNRGWETEADFLLAIMITNLKEIATESPVEEVWKNLRFFLHVDSVRDLISELHKDENPRKSDVDKQAKQLAYCIRQAEEYFRASSDVDLPTRPNLLYYGAVSLSRALVLLRKNGEHSFDALR